MLERSVDFFVWCVTIAAILIGAAGVMFAAFIILLLAYKALTWQANRITQRLINLQGLRKTREMYHEVKKQEGSEDE